MATALTIGRKKGNDIVISSPYLSSTHAKLELVDIERLVFRITDLASTNGTTVNGRRVEECEFGLGDQVKLGEYQLTTGDFLARFCRIEPVSGGGEPARRSRPAASGGRTLAVITLLLGGVVGSFWPAGQGFTVASERAVAVISVLAAVVLLVAAVMMLSRVRARHRADQAYFRQRQEGLAQQLERDLKKRELEDALAAHSWTGFRKFEVVRKERECDDITSFYLKPHDQRPIPAYRPGQYLTFKLSIPGSNKPVVRCYSLSDAPGGDYYRVSIKKAAPPPDIPGAPWGLSSSHFHEAISEGDFLDVKMPSGNFCIDVTSTEPVVLAAGGVGVTPMLSMLNGLVKAGARQPIWFFYGVKSGGELIQGQHIRALAEQHDNVNVVLCFSRPAQDEQEGVDYHVSGRVTVDLFKERLGSNNYAFYLCGSGPFMQSLTEGLREWGVPADKIHMEAFGPSSLPAAKPAAEPSRPATSISVEFAKSGKTVTATSVQTVLEIAEANGISLDYGCRAGNCGTCLLALRGGEVAYDSEHDADIEAGSCLACIAKPASNLTVDA